MNPFFPVCQLTLTAELFNRWLSAAEAVLSGHRPYVFSEAQQDLLRTMRQTLLDYSYFDRERREAHLRLPEGELRICRDIFSDAVHSGLHFCQRDYFSFSAADPDARIWLPEKIGQRPAFSPAGERKDFYV